MITPRPLFPSIVKLPGRLIRLAFCVVALTLPTIQAQADQQAELKQLQQNIQKLQQELKTIQGNRSALQQELQKSESEMGQLQKKIDGIRQDINEQNKELENLNKEREQLQEARRKQQGDIAEQIRVAHRAGEQSAVRLLLNQESPETVTRILGYHERIFAAHHIKLDNYLATLEKLDAIEPQILDQQAVLQANAQQLEEQAGRLKQEQARRQQVLASMNTSLKTGDSELRQMEEDRKRLVTLIQQVERTVGSVPMPASGEAFSKRQGKMPWPTKGQLTTRFGAVRPNTRLQSEGIVITANAGQPVIAVHHGRVVFADYFRGHGLLVIVDHGEGYLSLYAHNQSLSRATGEWVNAGDVIAKVGNSGGQEKNGLYFEIRRQGKTVNPVNWLARV